jgi:hypothetical protein
MNHCLFREIMLNLYVNEKQQQYDPSHIYLKRFMSFNLCCVLYLSILPIMTSDFFFLQCRSDQIFFPFVKKQNNQNNSEFLFSFVLYNHCLACLCITDKKKNSFFFVSMFIYLCCIESFIANKYVYMDYNRSSSFFPFFLVILDIFAR